MKNILLITWHEEETQKPNTAQNRAAYSSETQGTRQDRLTMDGLVHTYSITLPK